MKEGPIIPEGVSEEERKALRHSGGHGEGSEGPTGQRQGGRGPDNTRSHRPFKPDKGYTGHGKGVGDRLPRRGK